MTAARIRWVALFACFAAVTAAAQPPKLRGEAAPAAEPMIGQLMVKLRAPTTSERVQALGAQRVSALSASAGVTLKSVRAMSGDASVMRLPNPVPLSEARAVAAKLASDAAVEWAEPDLPVKALQTTPPDQGYLTFQWNLFPPTESLRVEPATGAVKFFLASGGANLPSAWARTFGTRSVVVAVIDTGIAFGQTDLRGQLLRGYDFVSSGALQAQGAPENFVANDFDGREGDPSDPGDWITASEKSRFSSICVDPPAGVDSPSSWHGTHMAGIVAAAWGNNVDPATNVIRNGTRIAGIAPGVSVLPVRALGKCGGSSSDVIDAIRWAAGLPASSTGQSWASLGIPANPTPARVINLSLGGVGGPCGTGYREATAEAVARGAVVVAAAGNDGAPSVLQPANCLGVLAVAAHAINGDSSDFSNVGTEIAISAPGGGLPTSLAVTPTLTSADEAFSIWSTGLFGATTQESSVSSSDGRTGPSLLGITGTSPATPHVSAAAALLLSVNPSLRPQDVRSILQRTARPHPVGGFCVSQLGAGTCGAGLLDIGAALIDQVSAVPPVPPSMPGPLPDPLPPPIISGGGGGGALPPWTLVLLAALLFAAQLRRRASRASAR